MKFNLYTYKAKTCLKSTVLIKILKYILLPKRTILEYFMAGSYGLHLTAPWIQKFTKLQLRFTFSEKPRDNFFRTDLTMLILGY